VSLDLKSFLANPFAFIVGFGSRTDARKLGESSRKSDGCRDGCSKPFSVEGGGIRG
jgi:hypothetical protein